MMLQRASTTPSLTRARRDQCHRISVPLRPCALARASLHKTSPSSGETSASSVLLSAAVMVTPLLLPVAALAAETGEYPHLIVGTTAALVHPALMFFLLGSTGYSAYLGWQWRRTRTMPEEIKALKAQLPAASAEGVRPPSPLDAEIATLEQTRKTLVAGGFRDKHWQWSSLILAMGTGIAIEGASNTFIRTGKLFPGPHLYFGLIIVFLWAFAAALVPAMQKGNDTARTAHISLNAINGCLFLSQVPTGLEIVEKVFQFTTWP